MAYVPNPLPPRPPVNLAEVIGLLEKANQAVGELNGVISTLVDPSVINYMYVRKEALLSSQIEGTQSTLDDLLKFESHQIKGISVDDAAEVSSYVAALNYGIRCIEGGFPLSLRLIKEIHKMLLKNTRGQAKSPGAFRQSQNWIGGTRPGNARFVPVPPDKLMDVLGQLELFMNEEDDLPALIKAALLHVQFETIHPFLDGNGRLGRLLVTFFLCLKGMLKSPILYLSLFLKKNRSLYYDHLNNVRYTGDWESWINFFLEGVVETADDARETLIAVEQFFSKDKAMVETLGRASKSALIVFAQFEKKPILTISELVERTHLSRPTITSMVKRLVALKIIKGTTDKTWGETYAYSGYIDLLRSESEPL
jgi:Fic family protein